MPFHNDLRVGYFDFNFNMSWYYEFLTEREMEIVFPSSADDDDNERCRFENFIQRAFEKYIIAKIFCPRGAEENEKINNDYDDVWEYVLDETYQYIKERNTDKFPDRINIKYTNEEEENDVDDFESPNIYPYKKCSECEERKSCGSYSMEKQWFCEDCSSESESE